MTRKERFAFLLILLGLLSTVSQAADPNCEVVSNTGECTRCKQYYQLQATGCVICNDRQYYVHSDYTCHDANPECDVFSNVDGTCLTCTDKQKIADLQGRCVYPAAPIVIPNCASYNPLTGICVFCQDFFRLANGSCVACTSRQYFVIDSYQHCYDVSPDCNTFNNRNGDCLTCINTNKVVVLGKCIYPDCPSGKYYTPNGCYPVSILCLEYNMTNGNCLTCKRPDQAVVNGKCVFCGSRQIIVNNTCVDVSPLCSTWNTFNGSCLSCLDSTQVLVNGVCTPPSEIRGDCATYDSSGRFCLTCKDPHMIISDGICFSPCETHLDGQTYYCLTCRNHYQSAANGVCTCNLTIAFINSYGECYPLPPNCQEATPNYACKKCKPTFTLTNNGECTCENGYMDQNGNTCTKSQLKLCLEYDATGVYCRNCIQPYFVSPPGYCVYPTCLEYDWKTFKCIKCRDGLQLDSNGNCVQPSTPGQVNPPANCLEKTSQGQCVQCANGYTLVNNSCQPTQTPTTNNCLEKNSQGQCVQCAYGYTLVNNNCQPTQTPVIPNCLEKNSLGQCVQCATGFKLVDQKCQGLCEWGMYFDSASQLCFPVQCPVGQVLHASGTYCIPMPAYCLEFNSFLNQCRSCDSTHVLIDFVCKAISEVDRLKNCEKIDYLNVQCIACLPNWSMDNYKVCSIQSTDPLRLACASDQYLVNGICVTKPPHCLALYSTGLCSKCEYGYQLRDYLCVLSQNCPEGQTLTTEGKCITIILNCFNYDQQGNCQSCPNGQLPAYGVCCPAGMTNSGGQCIRQGNSYGGHLSSSSTCLVYHPYAGYCLQCSNNGKPDPAQPSLCI